jgi:hypothetical protein
VLKTKQAVAGLTRNTLQNLTDGNSFAIIIPQVGLNELPMALSIRNTGSQPLTGVTISVREGIKDADNPSPLPDLGTQSIVGTLSPHELRLLPITITPYIG